MLTLTDHFGRSIHDLRISITDRCNYKCVYCRTGTNGAAYAELPFDDYLRMARILVGLGITKIRLTGGEPLLRKGIVQFVRDLTQLRTTEGKKPEIALTTNGHLLAEIAQALKDAGLDRITISMDAVDPERFARITRVPNGYESVLAGVRASRRAGLDPATMVEIMNASTARSFATKKAMLGGFESRFQIEAPLEIGIQPARK